MFVKLERELTKDDVGKKVKLRNGDIDTIVKISSGDEYPLLTEEASYDMFGRFFTGSTDNVYDIVEIDETVADLMAYGQVLKDAEAAIMHGALPVLTVPNVAIAGYSGTGYPPGIEAKLDELFPIPSYKTSPTIQINIQSGMTVIKGKFLDSSGDEWYVTLDKV